MEKPTSQLVEQAVQAIKQGEIDLETGETRFGKAWPEIKGEVALILDLEKAGKSFKASLPPPNLSGMWAQILPDLTPIEMVPGSETTLNFNHTAPAASVKVAGPGQAGSGKGPEPGKLPARKSAWVKWRKPLAWAAAIVLLAVISLSSLAGVAQAAEPGDFFYGTKLWLDNARQYVAFSPEDRQNFALSYCAHRSEELEWLVKNNKLQYFSVVAADYRQTLENAFPNDTPALSSEQANQLKAQQTRLNRLSGQLSTANTAGASQAGVEVNKLVEQLGAFQITTQNNPVPTTTPGPAAQTSTVSPGATAAPTAPATISVPTPTVTGPVPSASPTTPDQTGIAPPTGTPTPTPNPGSDSGVVLAYHPTPTATPTPTVANGDNDQDADGDINNSENDHDADDLPSNSNGSSSGSNSGNGNDNDNGNGNGNNGQHKGQTPGPTTVPAPTATSIPTPTPTPAPTAGGSENGGNDNNGGNNNGGTNNGGSNNGNNNGGNNNGGTNNGGTNSGNESKATQAPPTQPPTITPGTSKPEKTKKP